MAFEGILETDRFQKDMFDLSESFSDSLNKVYIKFEDSMTEFYERTNEHVLITEKEAESLSIKMKNFFADIVTLFENIKTTLQSTIVKKTQEKAFKDRLNKLYNELKGKQEDGIKKVELIDVWNYVDTFENMNAELSKYARKFVKVKYTSTADIDKDIATFNSIVAKYEKKLDEISKNKIKVPTKKMIQFVEDEISNRSRLMKILNDNMALFREFQNESTLIEKRKDILGPEILPKHIGLLRRIAYGISNFIKKWVIRIMTTIILLV